MPGNGNLFNSDAVNDLCAVRLFWFVIENKQTVAGEPFRDGARRLPNARVAKRRGRALLLNNACRPDWRLIGF